ncbi:X-domain of DnaJ-containing-domain-containing protein [Hysterangium stoloniferum]|nr:X-domain of DnaJ-containing-domain-containing protein [Hysterangium stoloniferum]
MAHPTLWNDIYGVTRSILSLTHNTGSASSFSTGDSKSHSGQPKRTGGRSIGAQERPLETEYYEILGIKIDATMEKVKKAYHDPNAGEMALSDPVLPKKYNEFGSRESQPEGGFADPEEFLSQLFGGESAMKDEDAASGSVGSKRVKSSKDMTPEEKAQRDEKRRKEAAERAAVWEERVGKLVEELERKLSIFTEPATGVDDKEITLSWRSICELEAEQLRDESYGVELLHSIGFVYTSKARHLLASKQTFMGVGGWFHNVQGKCLQRNITAAEKSGTLSPEEKRKLEEAAVEKGSPCSRNGSALPYDIIWSLSLFPPENTTATDPTKLGATPILKKESTSQAVPKRCLKLTTETLQKHTTFSESRRYRLIFLQNFVLTLNSWWTLTTHLWWTSEGNKSSQTYKYILNEAATHFSSISAKAIAGVPRHHTPSMAPGKLDMRRLQLGSIFSFTPSISLPPSVVLATLRRPNMGTHPDDGAECAREDFRTGE